MDSRVKDAQFFLDNYIVASAEEIIGHLEGAIQAYEERLRVSVGIINENGALKAKLRAPEATDLSTISSTELLAELARRV